MNKWSANINLFRSKTRTNLLLQFFVRRRNKFFMRELSRILGVSVGNVRRELINLEKQDIIKSEKIGNLKFYSVNKNNPIYRSLKEIIVKTIGIPDQLRDMVKNQKDIILAFIYGSYANGEIEPESDIDFFVLVKNNRIENTYENLNRQVAILEKKFDREININWIDEAEFLEKIREKNPFIKDITSGNLIFIKGGENDLQSYHGPKAKS